MNLLFLSNFDNTIIEREVCHSVNNIEIFGTVVTYWDFQTNNVHVGS